MLYISQPAVTQRLKQLNMRLE
ncbi:hypothetical protein FOB69_07275 [Staphylococcus hominis]|uniref:HTH lysR-type domain-containing protein n=1 Tax=Staphylococcus hominis TaxID=1290 RepID=A0A6N0I4M6_STAHO|nr:hypothetical protein FOB69_07275 [Staphylococcus hominis]